ncbi:hypothetical protein PSFL107428_23725 [Pseudoalteromonas maricaloris]
MPYQKTIAEWVINQMSQPIRLAQLQPEQLRSACCLLINKTTAQWLGH